MNIVHSPSSNSLCVERTRLLWLDFASGVMLLWMILYHAISYALGYELEGYRYISDMSLLPNDLHRFVSISQEGTLEVLNPCSLIPWLHFFMPWFFYKSGMFFQKRSLRELWYKDSKKLLGSFIIWSLVGFFVFVLIGLVNNSITLRTYTYSIVRGLFLTGKVPVNIPLWFLLTLFMVRFIANKFLPDRENTYVFYIKIFLVILVGYIVSYVAYRYNHRLLPYWVANSAAGLSFFALGYAMRDIETKWWLVAPSMIVYLIGCVVGFPMVDMWPNKVVNGNYMLWIPVAFSCILIFNSVCRFIYSYIRVKPLEWIGQNAMTIYVSHILIISVVVDIILRNSTLVLSPLWVVSLIMVMCALLLPICCWLRNIIVRRYLINYNQRIKNVQ